MAELPPQLQASILPSLSNLNGKGMFRSQSPRAGSDYPSLSHMPIPEPITVAWVIVQLELGRGSLPHHTTAQGLRVVEL